MRLWRLSGTQHAAAFDGGYGLHFEGRWNSAGRPVTYAATAPSLCLLEKLVHIEDPRLLPALAMVTYEVPDEIPVERWEPESLPADWRRREVMTQQLGDAWLASDRAALLAVPSVIVPLADAPDRNVLINHRHADVPAIRILGIEPVELDVRLFRE